MKRFAIIVTIMLLAGVLAACSVNKAAEESSVPAESSQSAEATVASVMETETETEQDTTAAATDKMLSLDKVKELAKQGSALGWADFDAYAHTDIGSGIYIYQYDIDDNFELLISGTNLQEEPLYILLSCKHNGNQIDIRDADINEFILKNTTE